MSGNKSSTSYTYSYSSSSSSSSAGGRQVHSTSAQQSAFTDASGNTTVQTTHHTSGQPAVQDTRYYDAQGRELAGDASQTRLESSGGAPRIEDVTDRQREADRLYEERIEDEYAKREGGA